MHPMGHLCKIIVMHLLIFMEIHGTFNVKKQILWSGIQDTYNLDHVLYIRCLSLYYESRFEAQLTQDKNSDMLK